MKFLVDNAVSPFVASGLREQGHDAVHVLERGCESAADGELFLVAQSEQRIIVSSDTDFAVLLALRAESTPSLILFRGGLSDDPPPRQLSAILRALPDVEQSLSNGSIVVLQPGRIRVRRLPIGSDPE
ncbi:MAG TPA: DUF5615 family PIN-like protein [Micropepsaceae bacterium]|nr:DUF5615 family PIN-like protein [Micropepsaceae bacterium]